MSRWRALKHADHVGQALQPALINEREAMMGFGYVMCALTEGQSWAHRRAPVKEGALLERCLAQFWNTLEPLYIRLSIRAGCLVIGAPGPDKSCNNNWMSPLENNCQPLAPTSRARSTREPHHSPVRDRRRSRLHPRPVGGESRAGGGTSRQKESAMSTLTWRRWRRAASCIDERS